MCYAHFIPLNPRMRCRWWITFPGCGGFAARINSGYWGGLQFRDRATLWGLVDIFAGFRRFGCLRGRGQLLGVWWGGDHHPVISGGILETSLYYSISFVTILIYMGLNGSDLR